MESAVGSEYRSLTIPETLRASVMCEVDDVFGLSISSYPLSQCVQSLKRWHRALPIFT